MPRSKSTRFMARADHENEGDTSTLSGDDASIEISALNRESHDVTQPTSPAADASSSIDDVHEFFADKFVESTDDAQPSRAGGSASSCGCNRTCWTAHKGHLKRALVGIIVLAVAGAIVLGIKQVMLHDQQVDQAGR